MYIERRMYLAILKNDVKLSLYNFSSVIYWANSESQYREIKGISNATIEIPSEFELGPTHYEDIALPLTQGGEYENIRTELHLAITPPLKKFSITNKSIGIN